MHSIFDGNNEVIAFFIHKTVAKLQTFCNIARFKIHHKMLLHYKLYNEH